MLKIIFIQPIQNFEFNFNFVNIVEPKFLFSSTSIQAKQRILKFVRTNGAEILYSFSFYKSVSFSIGQLS